MPTDQFRIVGSIPGWSSTTGEFEVWDSGHSSIAAAGGRRLLELNANKPGTIFQDFATTPGTTIRWTFAHRGRDGTESVQLLLGPAGGSQSAVHLATTGRSWTTYTGTYAIPAGQTVTRITLRSQSPGSAGNLIDSVSVQLTN